MEFLGEQVALDYPADRADIEPVIQAQIDLEEANKEHGEAGAPAMAATIQLAAVCVAAVTKGEPAEWFRKLYRHQHETGEHLMKCALVVEAMARCGLATAAERLGKEATPSG